MPRRKGLATARRTARTKTDKAQNNVISKLASRIKRLEGTTVERKYLRFNDNFDIGGGGQVKSRSILRIGDGTYDGFSCSHLFGTKLSTSDRVYVRYILMDVMLKCENDELLSEAATTPISLFLLKPRRDFDGGIIYHQVNMLESTTGALITQNEAGMCYVNPKALKVIKKRQTTLGGIAAFGDGVVAHKRYQFKIPVNKMINLQKLDDAVDNNYKFPTNFQDSIFLAISAAGSSLDGEMLQANVSGLICYDDSGDN